MALLVHGANHAVNGRRSERLRVFTIAISTLLGAKSLAIATQAPSVGAHVLSGQTPRVCQMAFAAVTPDGAYAAVPALALGVFSART